MPDQMKPFQIETDASKYTTGAVLTQLDSNRNRHPILFISKTFSLTEQNYEICDRELLAIIHALNEWQHYIQGTPHTTTSTPPKISFLSLKKCVFHPPTTMSQPDISNQLIEIKFAVTSGAWRASLKVKVCSTLL